MARLRVEAPGSGTVGTPVMKPRTRGHRGYGLVDVALAAMVSMSLFAGVMIVVDHVAMKSQADDLNRSALHISSAIRTAARHLPDFSDLPARPNGRIFLERLDLPENLHPGARVTTSPGTFILVLPEVHPRACRNAVTHSASLGRGVVSAGCIQSPNTFNMRVTYTR